MPGISVQVLIILLLIVANGLFAMAEIAVISSRKARLKQLAESGDSRAQRALDLAEAPNRFLSTVQVGITLIGTLAGALGGAGLSDALSALLSRISWLAPYAHSVALALVVLVITLLSLVLGELVPKRLGLSFPETIARYSSGGMNGLSRIASPLVSFLGWSTDAVLKLLRVSTPDIAPITEEELTILLAEGTEAGVFDEAEHAMVRRVLLLDDLRASSLMTPRPDIFWLDIEDSAERIARRITDAPYSRFPVARGSLDTIVGEVNAKDLLAACLEGESLALGERLSQPLYVAETMPALRVLEAFKQSGTQMALVVDEYANLQGLVTLTDILEAIVGDIPDEDRLGEAEAVQREDGSWLLDGRLTIPDLRELLDIEALPDETQGYYQTVAGFVVMQFGHIPSSSDHFDWQGLRFEVMDMDGPRVDKVLVSPAPKPPPQQLED